MRKLPAGRVLIGATDAQEREFALQPLERIDIAFPRKVQIVHDFAIGAFDVTRKEFASFVRESGYHVPSKCIGYRRNVWASRMNWLNPGFHQTDTDPAVCVSAQDASAYVRWLSKKTGKQYRLPTEAEWEYAARADSIGSNYWDDHVESACKYANVTDETYFEERKVAQGRSGFPCNDRYASTSPVGSFEPNGFGLFDMLGNVSQITQDCYAYYISTATRRNSSTMIADCMERPVRGGSYQGLPKYETFWMRAWIPILGQHNATGFRVARDLPKNWGRSAIP
jgi:formylglycine-generating enzyme required for sulfatase activity